MAMRLRSFPCSFQIFTNGYLLRKTQQKAEAPRTTWGCVHESARSAPNHLGVKLTWVRKQHWIGPRHRVSQSLGATNSALAMLLEGFAQLSPFSAGRPCLLLMILYIGKLSLIGVR